MKIVINNKITLSDGPQDLLTELKSRLSFLNPKFEENEKRGYSNWETPQILKFYEINNGNLTLPRGFIRKLLSLCKRYNVNYQISDNRRSLDNVKFKFHGKLRPFQEIACKDILSHDFGTLSAPTGSGKTVMCLYLIAQRKQPALIICHTRELQNQWVNRIETFLGIRANQIGVIGNGKKQIGEKITVALIQSLYKCANEIKPCVLVILSLMNATGHLPGRSQRQLRHLIQSTCWAYLLRHGEEMDCPGSFTGILAM